MKFLINSMHTLFVGLLLCVVGVFLIPLIPNNELLQIRIVQSGSMEPAIPTGSLIFITPAASYETGAIITFESSSAEVPTTHRVVSIEEREGRVWYQTKGDANEEVDKQPVAAGSVIGKVMLSVPYAGYILDFARQPLGFGLLIVLPAVMIIFGEIEKIWVEIRKVRKKKREHTNNTLTPDTKEVTPHVETIVRMIEIDCPIVQRRPYYRMRKLSVQSLTDDFVPQQSFQGGLAPLAVVLAVGVVIGVSSVGSTISYFNDTETTTENRFEATTIDFAVTSDGNAYGFAGTVLDDDDEMVITIVTPNENSAEMIYTVDAQKISGSDTFCNAILVSAGAPGIYDGQLRTLSVASVQFDAPWELIITLDPLALGIVPAEMCSIELTYTGYHTDAEGVGYVDIEKLLLQFSAPEPEPQPLLQSTFSLPITETNTISTEFEEEQEEIPEIEEEIEIPTIPEENEENPPAETPVADEEEVVA